MTVYRDFGFQAGKEDFFPAWSRFLDLILQLVVSLLALKDASLPLVTDAFKGMAFQTEQSTAVSCETAALESAFALFFEMMSKIV